MPRKLIPCALLTAREGKRVEVYRKGVQVRDWLSLADHARAQAMMLKKGVPCETYCVGGRAEKRNIDMVSAICSLLDERRPRADGRPYGILKTRFRDRRGHDRRDAVDALKIRRDFSWQSQESFDSFNRPAAQVDVG
ncbi:GDP-mannose 4,6-dehydratase [Hyphomonas sp.]|uniref:GDP-mannose 4,6-dehydratase n=1 Tax=Hyphomonas sp. TaxID=87 RepID=UPI003454EF04